MGNYRPSHPGRPGRPVQGVIAPPASEPGQGQAATPASATSAGVRLDPSGTPTIAPLSSLLHCAIPPLAKRDLSFLFRMSLNPSRGLSQKDFETAAGELRVEVEQVRAVTLVETPRGAFEAATGRPTILFERHYFHRLTNGVFDKLHSDISNVHPGGYGKYSAQYGKLGRAYVLDAEAALKSASWGAFQILGNNHVAAGFGDVGDFVYAMTQSEAAHLRAFTAFLLDDSKTLAALRLKDWAGFAQRYNGPKYKDNQYDVKLKKAYDDLVAAAAANKKSTP